MAALFAFSGCKVSDKGYGGYGTSPAEDPLARGEYLVTSIAGCGNCHTPKGPDGEIAALTLAGGQPFPEEGFTAYASNITPDKKTGIGNWTAGQIVDAIRNGKRPDGSLIGPPMPIELYRGISDADAHAMAVYLISLTPVENEVPKSEYNIPLPDSYGPPVIKVAEMQRGATAEYGAYLAGPVGHCLECHTPMVDGHLQLDTQAGAGGREFHGPWGVSVSADIRAGNPDFGLGTWSDKAIAKAVTQGVRPDDSRMLPPMGYHYYDRMTSEDLGAVIAFLRTMAPE